jgi:uncharacterized protein with HEPN domain
MRTVQQYLTDLIEQLELIETFTLEGGEHFLEDQKTQYAVIRAYEVIGEIVKRLPVDLLAAHSDVDWQQLKGFRDFLIHNYHRVTPARIWDAVEDLPNLKSTVKAMQTPDEDTP